MVERTRDISHELPVAFLIKMASLLGDAYDDFISSLHQLPRIGLRVNTLKVSPEQLKVISPYPLSPLPWCSSGFVLEADSPTVEAISPGKHPYHSAGLYYLQEPSAQACAELLSPQPGEKVLDLAAAPGGKSTHIAALMNNTGLLVANEIHPERVWDLAENLERCGVTNAIVTNESPSRLAEHFAGYFDRVMLDAPCSGEGMFRKSEQARRQWKPELPASCAFRQSAILSQAARMVKPGGCLAYTTCTFSPEENEAVIFKFLDTHPQFDLHTVDLPPHVQPARPEWIGLPQDHPLKNAMRIWSHDSPGEGHFIALLSKSKYYQDNSPNRRRTRASLRRNDVRSKDVVKAFSLLSGFARSSLNLSFNDSQVELAGSYLYLHPECSPELDQLKVIHPGWWLGSVQKNRFIPAHALAMALHADQVKQVIPLRLEDLQVLAYLAGESFTFPGDDGWALVTVDGYPLGWGKRVANVVKNLYPRGLRRNSGRNK